jgi:hypothetical protein
MTGTTRPQPPAAALAAWYLFHDYGYFAAVFAV